MRLLLAIIPLMVVSTVVAQETPEPGHGLPHTLAPSELSLIEAYRNSRGGGTAYLEPPSWEPRTTAEWEEVQSVVVTWTSFPDILKRIVREAKLECEVIIACDDSSSVINYLNGADGGGPLPDLTNITFLVVPFNSIWGRDYGAESMYKNEVDSLYLLDWIYNRPRPDDDDMPLTIANFLGLPIFSTTQAPYDLVHTGGNFMSDGFGNAFSSYLVYDENGPGGQFNQTDKTPAQVDALMDQWMGINQYITMPTLPYDAIHHIDMHMKLLDEERLLVGEFPVGVSDGPQIETNLANHVAVHNSVFGSPYELIRVPMPSSTGGNYPPDASYRTYANNIFLNKLVLVPTYREEYDTTGLRILQEALPGYRIVGIDCDNSGNNIVSQSGAIHCISKGIGVDDPLLIRHQRLRDTYETITPYTVVGYIRHRTGITGAEVYWTTDTAAGFNTVAMTDIGGNNWSADIPAQAAGSTVFYYIHATATSGKQQVRPIVAPDGWWKFKVLDINAGVDDSTAPMITEVFPNPSASLIMVTLNVPRGPVHVYLTDATGRTVMELHNGGLPADNRVFADISGLSSGAYLVVAESATGRSVQRVVRK
ncbi:MAG: agmatine deiminase family protein [Flavobacteriales bacterium]|nr:agmatine deiminase family protein [Flavobacteriales bacterium]MBP6696029.1 agmatine deiminase family protein [Flavobacteriales bacterium]